MNGFWQTVSRINLLLAFVILLAAHLLLYYMLGTNDWIMVALTASLVDTAVVAGFQLYAAYRGRGSAK